MNRPIIPDMIKFFLNLDKGSGLSWFKTVPPSKKVGKW